MKKHISLMGSAIVALLIAACGAPKPEDAAPPAPPPIVDLPVTPASAWDSMQVDIANAFRTGDRIKAAALRSRLMKFETEPGPGDSLSDRGAFPGPTRPVRLYLLGQLAVLLADKRGLQAASDSLLGPPMMMGKMRRSATSYAMALQAIIYLQDGRFDEGLARLDSLLAKIPAERYPMLWVGGTIERPLRIQLLRNSGKTARADSLAGTLTTYAADKLIRQ